MRHFTLRDSPRKPVSHDPTLIKSLLVDDNVLPGIKGISHIMLPKGSNVETHVHEDGHEVFYIIGGKAIALAGKEKLGIGPGHCLIVEPGEPHGFIEIQEDTEMLYIFLESSQ
jgi:mannose-6-phosphate isomerase-like protein (cupin superfamily)